MQVLYLRLRSRAGVRTEDAAAAGADADVALHDNTALPWLPTRQRTVFKIAVREVKDQTD